MHNNRLNQEASLGNRVSNLDECVTKHLSELDTSDQCYVIYELARIDAMIRNLPTIASMNQQARAIQGS